jgi:hypothetical protein
MDALFDPPRDVDAERLAPGVLGHVQVGFVQRERFDERRDGPEDREYLLRDGPVLLEIGPHDGQIGAEADGPGHRDGRSDAEPARLVAGRRHHATRGRRPPDRHGPAGEFRSVTLLDRRVEGVHVHVDDAANHGKLEV